MGGWGLSSGGGSTEGWGLDFGGGWAGAAGRLGSGSAGERLFSSGGVTGVVGDGGTFWKSTGVGRF